MDESRVLARLERIGALDRSGAAPRELLAELRGLLHEAEGPARAGGQETNPTTEREEVVGRLRTARAGDIIGM